MSHDDFYLDDRCPLPGPISLPDSGTIKSVVVFIHGYGASGSDLIGLSKCWRSLQDTLFIAPDAPEPCEINPSFGRQWFSMSDVSIPSIEQKITSNTPLLHSFLDYILEKTHIDSQSLSLVGFSQGTLMALHVGLRRKDPIGAIIGYSGALAFAHTLPEEVTNKPEVLLVHGDADQIVPVSMLHDAVKGLKDAGLDPKWHICEGVEHYINHTGLALGEKTLLHSMKKHVSP